MLKPGDTIGDRYIVEETLGQGGLAEVYRVRHKDLNSVHALKVLLWRRQSLIERMLLEGRIQAQLRHPHMVAVTDVIRHDGWVGLLMEYVDGRTLSEHLQSGALSLDNSLRLFAPILAAMTAAHDAGVLHRDLKPANILLARSPSGLVPKVADFGIAKVVIEDMGHGLTAVGSLMGSPGYLAPEQIQDSGSVDQRADIYALGVILYETLSGQRAFPDAMDEQSARAAASSPPPLLKTLRADLPDHIYDAVQSAIEPNREDRPPDCRALARALFVDQPQLLAMVERQQFDAAFSLHLSATPTPTPASTPPVPALATTPLPISQPDNPTHLTITPTEPPLSQDQPRLLIATVAILSVLLIGLVTRQFLLPPAPTTPAPPQPTADLIEPTQPTQPEPPQPEVVPEQEPEAAPGQEPEPEPEAVPEQQPDAVPEREPDAVPEQQPDAAPEAVPEAVPEQQPDAAPRPEEASLAPSPPAAPEAGAPEAPAPEEAAEEDGDGLAVVEPEEDSESSALERMKPVLGVWTGTANSQRFELEISSGGGDQLLARMTFIQGSNQRNVSASGTFDAATGAITLRSDADGLVFDGRLRGGQLSGSYRRGGRNRTYSWSVSQG